MNLVEPIARKIDLILDQATLLPERNEQPGNRESRPHQRQIPRLETLAERITVYMERARS